MLLSSRILVTAIVLAISAVSLSACGQQGPLYLPTEPAAANRATLPQTLWPSGSTKTAPEAQTKPASNQPPAPPATATPQ